MDFLDSLKNIKEQMKQEQNFVKKAENVKNSPQKKQESKRDEFEDIFLKEQRLSDEFSEFIKDANIKKI